MFKAIVVGTPTPTVTWGRANGEIHFHPDVCMQKYDEISREHTIEVSVACTVKIRISQRNKHSSANTDCQHNTKGDATIYIHFNTFLFFIKCDEFRRNKYSYTDIVM